MNERNIFMQEALEQCRKDVDPNTTKDTPNLMRNGTPVFTWTQWFSSFFGV